MEVAVPYYSVRYKVYPILYCRQVGWLFYVMVLIGKQSVLYHSLIKLKRKDSDMAMVGVCCMFIHYYLVRCGMSSFV